MKKKQILGAIIFFFFILNVCAKSEHTMWYRQPAKSWEEALPIGNGQMGAMVFGGTRVERIQLNEETIWSGKPKGRVLAPDYAERKALARQLIFEGKQKEAEALIRELKIEKYTGDDGVYLEKVSTTEHGYETAGDIYLYFDAENEKDNNYRRELDIETAISKTQFQRAGVNYKQEVICSYPDKVLAIRLTSDIKEKLSFQVKMNRPMKTGEEIGNFVSPPKKLKDVNPVKIEALQDNYLVMKGQASNHGAKFEVHLKAITTDGTCIKDGNSLEIKNSSEVTLFVHITTDYYGTDWSAQASTILDKAIIKGYEAIKEDHTSDYTSLYSRVRFDLGQGNTKYPTDVRLRNIRNRIDDPRYNKGQLTDAGLISLFYNYGRYMIISSSRQGTLPPALHFWNNSLFPAWYGRPTTNINQQMNYWGVEVANLSECHLPMLKLMEEFLPAGKEVAEKAYKSKGAVFPGRGIAITHAPEFIYDTWNDAGGWFGQHFYEHYQFTQDMEFLSKSVYPYLKEMAIFYLDNLVEHPTKGYLVTGPSYSAETSYIGEDGHQYHYANGVTLSKAIVSETLKNTLEVAQILDEDHKLQKQIANIIPKLSPYKVSPKYGTLQEWDEDVQGTILGHRHLSHLYPVYPGCDITAEKVELFTAAKLALKDRIDNGSGWTGWSRVWCIAIAARLGENNLAGEQVETLMRGQLFNNLFAVHKRGGHDVYVMDANLGFVGAMSEMLLQSHQGFIELLPALPTNWSNGEIEGLCARGGFVVDMAWEAGKLVQAQIMATKDGHCTVQYQDKKRDRDLIAGEVWSLEF